MLANCPGNIATDASGAALCVDANGNPLAWAPGVAFDPSQLDPLAVGGAFGAGFILLATAWAIGQGFKAVLRMIG